MPTFRWTFIDNTATREGEVEGVDLREAASRFFHSTPQGERAATKHAITPDILHEFPGNADPRATVRTPTYTLKLSRLDAPATQGVPA